MGNKLDKVFWAIATLVVIVIAGFLAYRGGFAVGEGATRTSNAVMPAFAAEVMQ